MNAETKTIRILAADDHALLCQGTALLIDIEPDMEWVAQAATGREAIEQFRRHQPDITLMDLQMPDMSGMEAIITIRGEFPNARIIVVTTYVGDVRSFVTSTTAPIATGWSEPVPGRVYPRCGPAPFHGAREFRATGTAADIQLLHPGVQRAAH